MFGIARTFRASVAGGLSFCLALTGFPLAPVATAEAATPSVIRISDSGPGARKQARQQAQRAMQGLPEGSPPWLRAQDIYNQMDRDEE